MSSRLTKKPKSMAHLMQQDVHVVIIDSLKEVTGRQLLTPVVTIAANTSHAIVEPQTNIVAALLTTRALRKISRVLKVRATVAADITLRHAISVRSSVDVKTRSVAFEQTFVFDSVADDFDVCLGEWEALETDQRLDPFVERAVESVFGLGAVGGGGGVGCVPADAVVDAAVVGDQLVRDPVLVFEAVRVLGHGVLPDLQETR